MQKKTLALTALGATLAASLIGGMALADRGDNPRRGGGDEGAYAQKANHHGGKRGGRHGRRGGGGGRGMLEALEAFDANGDGTLTQEELDAGRAAQLSEADANGDGSLTLDEYQDLWLNVMRPRMVDQFQNHDDDGDGLVTTEEFGERFDNFVARADRNGDGVLNEDDMRRRRLGGDAGGNDASE